MSPGSPPRIPAQPVRLDLHGAVCWPVREVGAGAVSMPVRLAMDDAVWKVVSRAVDGPTRGGVEEVLREP